MAVSESPEKAPLHLLEVVLQKCRVLRMYDAEQEALEIALRWVECWLPRIGVTHLIILELYGVIGELMIMLGVQGAIQNAENGFMYLEKYQYVSYEASQIYQEYINNYPKLFKRYQ